MPRGDVALQSDTRRQLFLYCVAVVEKNNKDGTGWRLERAGSKEKLLDDPLRRIILITSGRNVLSTTHRRHMHTLKVCNFFFFLKKTPIMSIIP